MKLLEGGGSLPQLTLKQMQEAILRPHKKKTATSHALTQASALEVKSPFGTTHQRFHPKHECSCCVKGLPHQHHRYQRRGADDNKT